MSDSLPIAPARKDRLQLWKKNNTFLSCASKESPRKRERPICWVSPEKSPNSFSNPSIHPPPARKARRRAPRWCPGLCPPEDRQIQVACQEDLDSGQGSACMHRSNIATGKWWCPVVLVEKATWFKRAKWRSLKEPCWICSLLRKQYLALFLLKGRWEELLCQESCIASDAAPLHG